MRIQSRLDDRGIALAGLLGLLWPYNLRCLLRGLRWHLTCRCCRSRPATQWYFIEPLCSHCAVFAMEDARVCVRDAVAFAQFCRAADWDKVIG